jgi:hypothetical protein
MSMQVIALNPASLARRLRVLVTLCLRPPSTTQRYTTFICMLKAQHTTHHHTSITHHTTATHPNPHIHHYILY